MRQRRGTATAVAAVIVAVGVAFLLNTPYLSVGFNSVFVTAYLGAIYWYARAHFGVRIPLPLLALVLVALQVDALGNYFHLYTPDAKPIRYDEFAHLFVQALIMPMIVWLAQRFSDSQQLRLPPSLVAFFAGTTMFSISALYEIIELWDDKYFGGHRIWSVMDTAEDLQWDLCGIVLGILLARVVRQRRASPLGSVGN